MDIKGRLDNVGTAMLQNTKAMTAMQNVQRGLNDVHDPKVEKAATDFEALLVNQMVKSMQQTVPQNGLLDSKDGAMYQDMLNESLSQGIAKGRGIGVKQVIMRELYQKSQSK